MAKPKGQDIGVTVRKVEESGDGFKVTTTAGQELFVPSSLIKKGEGIPLKTSILVTVPLEDLGKLGKEPVTATKFKGLVNVSSAKVNTREG